MSPTTSSSNATEATRNTGSSTNLCQSAHLLSLVLQHREEPITRPSGQQQPIVASVDGTISGDAGNQRPHPQRSSVASHHVCLPFTPALVQQQPPSGFRGPRTSWRWGRDGVDEKEGGGGAAAKASAAMAVAFSGRVVLCGLCSCNERWVGETGQQWLALRGVYDVAREGTEDGRAATLGPLTGEDSNDDDRLLRTGSMATNMLRPGASAAAAAATAAASSASA